VDSEVETVDPVATSQPAAPRARLRVLLVVESSAGGTGRHVLDLAQGLIARGCDVHLIYSTRRIDGTFQNRVNRIDGLHRVAIRMRTIMHPSDFGVVRAVKRYLREHGPFDAIHGHSSKGGAIARLAALGTDVPAFYTIHGLIMLDPGLAWWKRAVYLSIERLLSKRTAKVIAVSPEEQRAAIRLGFGEHRTAMVPNGIGAIALTPRHEARRALRLSDDAFVIGFVGRLVSQKAPHVLIESFAHVAMAAPNARLAMVGAGPLESELKALSEKLNVARKILWLGERDARGVLGAFDVFAMSSRKEGLPYVVLEAMAAGLPIIATASSGVEILIEPGVNGQIVATDDVEALSVALLRLASDQDTVARMGAASKRRAARFSIDAMVDETLAAYAAGAQVRTKPQLDDDDEELALATQ
jgi:glycosyltransferase involved in cell wall biosynthesis